MPGKFRLTDGRRRSGQTGSARAAEDERRAGARRSERTKFEREQPDRRLITIRMSNTMATYLIFIKFYFRLGNFQPDRIHTAAERIDSGKGNFFSSLPSSSLSALGVAAAIVAAVEMKNHGLLRLVFKLPHFPVGERRTERQQFFLFLPFLLAGRCAHLPRSGEEEKWACVFACRFNLAGAEAIKRWKSICNNGNLSNRRGEFSSAFEAASTIISARDDNG